MKLPAACCGELHSHPYFSFAPPTPSIFSEILPRPIIAAQERTAWTFFLGGQTGERT